MVSPRQRLGEADDGLISPLIPVLARTHRAKANELLTGTGLSPGQEFVIKRLYENPGQSQAEITRWLGVEAPTTAKMLARLEKGGFVERIRSERDHRAMVVSLTDRGRDAYARVGSLWEDLDAVTTAGLTDTDKAELGRLLRHVLANLAASQPAASGCLPCDDVAVASPFPPTGATPARSSSPESL